MKYLITGGAGHTSGPLTEKLLKAGLQVTLIGRDSSKLKKYAESGATIAAGSVEDPAFLEKAFSGADAAYLMLPPNMQVEDFRAYQKAVSHNYIQALKSAGIKKVVVLSSIGAHMINGAGPVDGLAYFEQLITKELPEVDVVFLRPSYFYKNFFQQIGLIKGMKIMGSNFTFGQEKMVLTHTNDIAETAFELLDKLSFIGKTVRYIASDERTTDEIGQILSASVGQPGIPWIQFPDDQAYGGMIQVGIKPSLAKDYVDMGIALREGKMQEDYWKNHPALGNTKLEDFAKEFALAYATN